MEFYFENDQALVLGSPAKKYENNLQAIRLAKEIIISGTRGFRRGTSHPCPLCGLGRLRIAAPLERLEGIEPTPHRRRTALPARLVAQRPLHRTARHRRDVGCLSFMGFGSELPSVITRPVRRVGHFKSLMPNSLPRRTGRKSNWTV